MSATTGSGEAFPVGSVELVTRADRSLVRLAGEVDASLNRELTDAFGQVARRGLPAHIDTRGTTFVDSTVIAAIAHLSRRLPAGVTVVDPPQQVRFLLHISEVEQLVTVTGPEPLAPGVRAEQVPV